MIPDVKEPRRIVDKSTIARFHKLGMRCMYCGDQPTDPHHIYLKSRGGDDVMANLVPLCRKCHDATHGSPYFRVMDASGSRVRVDGRDVRFKIGQWLKSPDGKEARAYLVGKLGPEPAATFMRREYGVRP